MKFNPLEVAGKIREIDRLPELKRLLAEHDWYFEYSDDFRVWRVGSDQRKAIKALAKELGIEIYEAAFEAFQNDKLKEFVEADL